MNILFLNSAHDWGGNEKWTYLAIKCLVGDHQVYLAYGNDLIGSRFDIDIENYKLPFLFEADLYSIAKIISIIKQKQIDILIPTKRKEYVLAGIAAKTCKKKNILRLGIVRELHNLWYNDLVYNKLADGIIVNAQQIKNVLLKSKFMDNSKVRVIYNGLDLSNLGQASKAEKPSGNCSFLVSSMGRLYHRKRFDYLIKGFHQFISSGGSNDCRLQIIGDGEELNVLKQLTSKLKVEDKISFTGFLSNPYPHLAVSDVFVLLSRNEGISNALLEAMYFKNAIITTAAGGVAEFIEDGINGYILEEANIKKIGELLQYLYVNPEKRRSMGEAAHQTVLAKFSLKAMKENIESFCKEVL